MTSTTPSGEHYNQVRLHGAIGYIAPADKLAGRGEEIWSARDRKLETARAERKRRREASRVDGERGLDNRIAGGVVCASRVKQRRALLESNPPRDSLAGLIALMKGRWGTPSAPDLNSSNDRSPMPS